MHNKRMNKTALGGTVKSLLLVFMVVTVPTLLLAQAADTTAVQQDTSKTQIKEMVLEEIHIEAVIEKPNVAILPTRLKPEFGKIEFIFRSFEPELKEGPRQLLLLESELETVKKVEKIKHILEKKKKKKKKE